MTGLEILGLAGTALSAVGAVAGGVQANNQARAQADAAERQANEVRASSQREAIQRAKEARLLMSRQQALASASGGAATDPSVLKIMGDTAEQGQYNTASALYEGDASAAGLQDQAALSRWQGRNEMFAGFIGAGSTVLNGLGGFAGSRKKNLFPMAPPPPSLTFGQQYPW